jgi:hypothetical protein
VGYLPLLRKVSFVWANSSLLLTSGIRWLSDRYIRPKQSQNSVAGFYSVGLTAGLKRYPGKAVVKCGVELGSDRVRLRVGLGLGLEEGNGGVELGSGRVRVGSGKRR